MNTTHRLTTPAVMIAATLAAAFMLQTAEAVEATPVVTLPRVEVVASRAALATPRVVQLPRVTVIGKRQTASPTLLAQKAAAPAGRL